MSIIDDWLRQHPNLTLTRDQRSDLEELIEEEYDDPSGFYNYGQGGDFSEDDRQEGFTAGATEMRKNIAALFTSAAHDNGDALGLRNALDHMTTAIEQVPIPEMPEED